MILSPDLPLHVLFASAAKHAMDEAIIARRVAKAEKDYWFAGHASALAERWRLAAWSHLAAAREAKRRNGVC